MQETNSSSYKLVIEYSDKSIVFYREDLSAVKDKLRDLNDWNSATIYRLAGVKFSFPKGEEPIWKSVYKRFRLENLKDGVWDL